MQWRTCLLKRLSWQLHFSRLEVIPQYSAHIPSQGCSRIFKIEGATLSLCQPKMLYEYYIHEFLIFCSSYMYKSVERKKIDSSRWPFKGRTDMQQKIQPDGLTGRCRLAGNSEGHRENSIFFLLYFSIGERNKISKDKECNLRQLFTITRNSVCTKLSPTP